MEAWQEARGSSLLGKDLEPHDSDLSGVRLSFLYCQMPSLHLKFIMLTAVRHTVEDI